MTVSNPWIRRPMVFSHGIWRSEIKMGIKSLINELT